ncbi:hypothetical protein ASG90_11335 [Nocardioides sp. Soil797]|nr:hypothetical protein ASG90_11335 [Nocardioides sp. Soil797]
MTVTTTAGSLRERKRIATWDALHEAAAALAQKHESIQAVTVEGIAELANVSPRTFFNYFATKEDAVLGNREPVVSEEALEAFRESTAPLVNRTADFYFDVMASSRTFGAGVERRLALVERHPELRTRQVAHFTHAEQMVREAALEHLTGWVLPNSVPTFEALVDLLVTTSSAALKIATRLPLTGSSATDADRRAAMHDVLLQLREVSLHIS